MEVLACIPELSQSATPAPSGSGIADATSATDPVERGCVIPLLKTGPARHVRTRGPFSPSIFALAAAATLIWAAALRNDQSRLETARLQRAERLAQELPPSAGRERSRTP